MLYRFISENQIAAYDGEIIRKRNGRGRLIGMIANPTEADLREAGYKDFEPTECPEEVEGFIWILKYIDGETITQQWQQAEIPEDTFIPELETEEQKAEREAAELLRAKSRKLAELEAYDREESPEGVNWFFAGRLGMWIKKADRSGLLLSIDASEMSGRETIALWVGDTRLEIPLTTAKQMLCALEIYATECYGVTAAHKAAINALTTTEEVDSYDFHTGYPDKIHFDL